MPENLALELALARLAGAQAALAAEIARAEAAPEGSGRGMACRLRADPPSARRQGR